MMGNFHSIYNLLSTIGKLFGDAGHRDLAVESGVIAEGSIIDGKQYNRAVWLHKLTYETLIRLAWSGFEEWLGINHAETLPKYSDPIRVMYKVRQNRCRTTHDAAMADESCQMIILMYPLTCWQRVRKENMPTRNSNNNECKRDIVSMIPLRRYSWRPSLQWRVNQPKEKPRGLSWKLTEGCLATWSSLLKAESWKCVTSCSSSRTFTPGIIKRGCYNEENKQVCIVKASWEQSVASRRSPSSECYNNICHGTHE